MIGICKCGCGVSTTLWEQSRSKKGVKKGQPRDFIRGHYQAIRKIKEKASCHPERDIKASGLCGSCYSDHEPENTAWNALVVLQLELNKVEALPENLAEDCAF